MIVWLASYPRSGNTFLRVVLNSYFGQMTHSLHNDVHDIAADKNMSRITGHENLPDDFDIEKARASDELFLIKTHGAPPDNDDRVVYLVRDGRESCWSYAHYRLDYHGAKSLEQSLEEVIRGEVVFGSWGEHLDSWAPQTRDNLLLIRFEDLVTSTEDEVKRLEKFFNIDALDASVPDFTELHALNSKFFRSGSTDSWRDGFPNHLLELFWLKSRTQMQRFGYDTLAPGVEPARPELLSMLQTLAARRVGDIVEGASDCEPDSDGNSSAEEAQELALRRLTEDFELASAATATAWQTVQRTNEEAQAQLHAQLQSEKSSAAETAAALRDKSDQLEALQEDQNRVQREHAELQQRHSGLIKEHESLTQERDNLLTEREALTDQGTKLTAERNSLLDERNTQSQQLGESLARLSKLLYEKEALINRNESLLDERGTLRKDLEANSATLAELYEDRAEILGLFEQLASSKAILSPRLKYRRYGALMTRLREHFETSRDSENSRPNN